MLKGKKGVTLVLLVVAIILMLIIFGVTISAGTDLIKNSEKNRLMTNLYLIRSKAATLLEDYLFDKTEIYNMINNNIPDVVEIMASHYEIPINKNELKTFVSELVNIVEKKEMKYFYEYLLFNNVKKYFYNQFDTLFIKKLIGIGPIKVEYNMTINEGFVNDAIKTLDYVLEDKAKSCDYSIDIYMMPSSNVSSVDLYRLINIIQNIGKIYEINEHLMDNIIEKIKENYELKNVSKKFYSNNNEYLELVRELKDDLQKEFENVYVAKVRDNKNISIDYKCLNRFLRRL